MTTQPTDPTNPRRHLPALLEDLESWAAHQLQERALTRPGGWNKQQQRWNPDIPYLPWEAYVECLNETVGGTHWGHEITISPDGDYLRVEVWIADDIGATVKRASVANIQHDSASRAPALMSAERTAFKRACSYFGMFLAPGAKPQQAPQPQRPPPQQAPQTAPHGDEDTPAAGGGGPSFCRCGVAKPAQYDLCRACNTAPSRTPGVCASCEAKMKVEFAQCWKCSQAKAAILPKYATRPAGEDVSIPGEVGKRIDYCTDETHFGALMTAAQNEGWPTRPWWDLFLDRIDDRCGALGFWHDREGRRFRPTGAPPDDRNRDVNDLPF